MSVPISEQAFSEQVYDLAARNKWRTYHARPGQTGGGKWATQMQGDVGFPDWVLVRGDRLIFAELKTDTGKVTDGQIEWLAVLNEVEQVTAQLWRPHDFDTIADLLARRPGPNTVPVGAPI